MVLIVMSKWITMFMDDISSRVDLLHDPTTIFLPQGK
tara:strand:- start:535 stop:645 length:111 start_codon:yes stop_codon:yes gene_type:complete